MTTVSGRNPGGFRAYCNEQKTLRAKLDQLLKWTRDLKTNIMKQSCKVLQTNQNNNNNTINRQIIDQVHDDLDEYKRKFDRELGRIHDLCDALINNSTTNGDAENLRDEILEALRRSPTYSSLEQHIYDDKRPRIRVKPRERTHPGQKQTPRTPISTDTIKRKASQPIALQVLDMSGMSGVKRRSQIDAFKRSRSFTHVEHRETQLGMDYVEEDESDLGWKPFGPKKSISHVSLTSINHEQSNDEQPSTSSIPTKQSLPKSSIFDADNSTDEEFDIAWERKAKQKARKDPASEPPPSAESPSKRTVRFTPSTDEPIDLTELDLDETAQDGLQPTKDPNNNNKQQTEVVHLDDDDDDDETTVDTQSQIATASTQQVHNPDEDSQIIDDSDDEIIALTDDEIAKTSSISRRKRVWTTSEIQISSENSQSQSLHNPYRIGIVDPSLRSVFLPPPNPQLISALNAGNKRIQGGNRKSSPTKRATSAK